MKNLLLIFCLFLLLGPYKAQAQCDPDLTPPVAVCTAELYVDVPPGPAGSATVTAAELNAGSYDACDPSNTLGYFLELAPPSSSAPGTTSLQFTSADAGDHSLVLWVVDAAGNAGTCNTTLHLNLCQSVQSLVCNDQVVVQLGVNNTYALDAFDMLEGGPYCNYSTYQVRLDQTGTPEEVLTLTPDDIGVHLMAVTGTGVTCWGTLIVNPGVLNADCPQLYVDISTANIRPCFSRMYQVYYANASALPIDDTYVEVVLDDYLTYESSSIPGSDVGNNTYRFETGDLNPGASGFFDIHFFTDCDAPVGTTHCSEARIYPDTICAENQSWSGAEIRVEGTCVNDSIFLKIKNTGDAPTTQVLGYVVVEDVLMLTDGSFSLAAGESFDLAPIAGSGPTYRLEAQQEPGYPYGGMPAVSVEGCGGFNPGMVTLFQTDDSNPAVDIYCRESTGSYDPNDKQALPKGYGVAHFIEKNTPLEYIIRFQNTGTDTAYKVVLVDTLSGFLDASTVRPGAASHPYTFDLIDGKILRITFDNILLPQKAVNEESSQGFAQFNIEQKPNLADGTRIENTAAIYFDFNAPIITNQTFHTVGSHFVVVVSTHETSLGLPQLQVFPNPATEMVHFEAAAPAGETVSFSLTDVHGRKVQERNAVTFPLVLQRGSLENGTYFFQFTGRDGRQMWSGKVLVK